MANNVFQVKRTNTSGRTPNTTGSYVTNSQYIAAGEFALNMADGILYTSNGSAVITVGSNLVNQRISNSVNVDNDKNIRFQTVNTAAYVGMRQQTDDNFVFYSTNTTYGQRPVWSIFANSDTSAFSLSSPTVFNAGVNLGQVSLTANGSTGTAGQVLTTNGSSTYWSTVSGSGSVNTAAQFAWTNIHTFSANVSFNGNGIGIASNTGAVYLGGISDANWRIGRNTGATTKWRYTNNSIDIITANSNLEGMTIGLINGNSYFETGYLGTFIASNVTIGNTSSNATINSTSFTGTASNASLLNNKTEGNLNVNNATTAYGKTEGNLNVNNATTAYGKAESALNVNSALTANNSTNLGGASAASYQTTAGLSANVATLTANNTSFVGTVSAANVVSNAQLSGNLANYVTTTNLTNNLANYQTTAGLSANVATLTANNANFVKANNGITSNSLGVFVNAQTPLVANATGLHIATSAGNGTFSSGISAITVDSVGRVTSVTGSAGYVTSSGVTSVATGNGMTGGTITTTGTVSILANTGVVANATGLFVNATYIGTLTANNTSFVGTVSAANVVSNAQLSANLANYQTSAGLSANVAKLTANAAVVPLFSGDAVAKSDITTRTETGFYEYSLANTVLGWPVDSGSWQHLIAATHSNDGNYYSMQIAATFFNQDWYFRNTNGSGTTGWSKVWHNNNDGAASGLDADLLDGQHGSFYTNATNITTGTLPYAQIPANVINTTAAFTRTGVTTFSANVVLGSSGLSANGGFGTAGQVLTTNATATYWAAAAGGGYYKGGSAAVGTLAVGGQNLFRVNANTLSFNTTIAAGENAQATGPISVSAGITLTVQSGARVSIV